MCGNFVVWDLFTRLVYYNYVKGSVIFVKQKRQLSGKYEYVSGGRGKYIITCTTNHNTIDILL